MGMSMIFTPLLVGHLLDPLGLYWPMSSTFWTYTTSKRSCRKLSNFFVGSSPVLSWCHNYRNTKEESIPEKYCICDACRQCVQIVTDPLLMPVRHCHYCPCIIRLSPRCCMHLYNIYYYLCDFNTEGHYIELRIDVDSSKYHLPNILWEKFTKFYAIWYLSLSHIAY